MMNALVSYICREILGAGNIARMVSTQQFMQLSRLGQKQALNFGMETLVKIS